ncbi:hypothetical protein C5167_031256 [Papaver somniferum]|nr:hypothetical protein C5167_031256 [Papaver somniferum]
MKNRQRGCASPSSANLKKSSSQSVPCDSPWERDFLSPRDRDRERAQARSSASKSKTKDDGLTPEQRRERDARALQEKAARKAAQGSSVGGENPGSKKGNTKK